MNFRLGEHRNNTTLATVLIITIPFRSHILLKSRALGLCLLQPKQEIEYISALNITPAIKTRRPQLHNILYFSPSLKSLTFYGPPSPSSARFCDTRISTYTILCTSLAYKKRVLRIHPNKWI